MANQPYSPDPRAQGYQQPPNYPVSNDNQAAYNGQNYGANDDTTIHEFNVGGAQGQNQRERYVDPAGNQVERRMEVIEDRDQARANARYWITAVTYFVLGVLEVILLLRFIFRLLGAHQDNGFIMFLYNLSHVFVAPFNGIFNDQALGTASVFEVSTLVAMLIYALIAWGIVSLGKMLFAPVAPNRQTFMTTRRRRYE